MPVCRVGRIGGTPTSTANENSYEMLKTVPTIARNAIARGVNLLTSADESKSKRNFLHGIDLEILASESEVVFLRSALWHHARS
jgi:hypothetical protein